jgi:hypothetical protein
MASEYKGIEVIGAGWGRTGTLSLMTALEILGYDPCYHMEKVIKDDHSSFWCRVLEHKAFDFKEIFEDRRYKASCDFPASFLWKRQLDAYPDAKVILTVRDPEKWYNSCMETIFLGCRGHPAVPLGFKVCRFLGIGAAPGFNRFIDLLNQEAFLNQCFNKSVMIEMFKSNIEDVKKTCPSDRLLVFEVSHGWEPLCKFLNKPVPSVPFPHVNDSVEFHERFLSTTRTGNIIISIAVAIPLIVGAIVLKRKGIF